MISINVPTYDGCMSIATQKAVEDAVRLDPDGICTHASACSLLSLGFNTLWATALNERPLVDRFVLIHSDIQPMTSFWLPMLMQKMDSLNVDVITTVIPIKAQGEETSTGKLDPTGCHYVRYRLSEVNTDLVERGDSGHPLLVNTGLMAVRFDKPWVEEFKFEMKDRITQLPDGTFEASCIAEDWTMSEWLYERKIPYAATKAIRVNHLGNGSWPNWRDE